MSTFIKILKIAIFFCLIALLFFALSKAFGDKTSFLKDIFSSIVNGFKNGYSNIAGILVPRNGA